MEKRVIGCGLLAGAIAGVFAIGFARVFLEPVIGKAIDYEGGRAEALSAMGGGHEHEMEVFTRGIQANVGMGFGVLGFGLAMGALFAVAFVVVSSRVTNLSARILALILAGAAFGTVYLVPFIKYPANPPAVGDADTIGARTGLYLLMIALSLGSAVGALWLGRHLAPRLGMWAATLCALGVYVVAVAITMLVLPGVSETPQPLVDGEGTIVYPGFPADDLYHFRLYTVATQVVMWVSIGMVFGTGVSRVLGDRGRLRTDAGRGGAT